ncbi:MAG: dipeptidase [Eubacteriales bacterium]|nr:dipeptidase [Eubacteriales bacterium]
MQIPVADAHCDFLYGMVHYGWQFGEPGHGDSLAPQAVALPYLIQGGVKLQFFAAWIDTQKRIPYLQQCLHMIDAYERMLEQHANVMEKLTGSNALNEDTIKTVLTVEGGEAIEGSLSVLRMLYRLGVRAMTLTWNTPNELSGTAVRKTNKGLTPLGREVVEEMCRIGMALDVSHLSDAGIDDALTIATRPIFASHSNCREVYNSPRSLTDTHIKAIAEQGGVIGVNFYHRQLCKSGTATVMDVVRQIDHIAEVGGINACAIGSDFDGMTEYPPALMNSAAFPALLQALLQAGYTEEQIRKIVYQNLYNYILPFVNCNTTEPMVY